MSSHLGVADTHPPASRLIGARYQLINELGRGGMGSVHRALDRVSGRIVTLKRLRARAPEVTQRDSHESRLMLAREFRLLASLRHPNIVSVLTYGFDEENQPYFTMDLEEGARTVTDAGMTQHSRSKWTSSSRRCARSPTSTGTASSTAI